VVTVGIVFLLASSRGAFVPTTAWSQAFSIMPDGNGSAPSCMPFQLGPIMVTPLPPHAEHRALRRGAGSWARFLQEECERAESLRGPE
jgi:hypothetical protein